MLTPMVLDSPLGPPAPSGQASILTVFLGFQSLDAITTHLGLGLNHVELNLVMRPVMLAHGELAAYAVKGIAVAMLLAALMLFQSRRPRVWQAFRVAGWMSAFGVLINVLQLI